MVINFKGCVFAVFLFKRACTRAEFLHSLLAVSHSGTSISFANLKLTFCQVLHIFSTIWGLRTTFNFNFDSFLLFERSQVIILDLVNSEDPLELWVLGQVEFSLSFFGRFYFIYIHDSTCFFKYAVLMFSFRGFNWIVIIIYGH